MESTSTGQRSHRRKRPTRRTYGGRGGRGAWGLHVVVGRDLGLVQTGGLRPVLAPERSGSWCPHRHLHHPPTHTDRQPPNDNRQQPSDNRQLTTDNHQLHCTVQSLLYFELFLEQGVGAHVEVDGGD